MMDKKLFIESIKALETQTKIDKDFSNTMEKFFPDGGIMFYDNDKLTNTLLKVLEVVTNDESKWIDYYCYELDFGKNNDELKVYNKDEKEIPLKTPEDLWNMLSENIDQK